MKRRIISLLLAVMMVFSLLPTAALADELEPGTAADEMTGSEISSPVARIGTTDYSTLSEAIAAAEAETETEIDIIADIHCEFEKGALFVIPADKNIILDLNGHTISGIATAADTSYLIHNQGVLTIKDSGAGGLITYKAINRDANNYYYATDTIWNRGELIIKGGTIENNTVGGASYAVDNSSQWYDVMDTITFNMYGGNVSCTSGDAAVRQVSTVNYLKNYVNIVDGTITGDLWVQSLQDGHSELSVTGGTITGKLYITIGSNGTGNNLYIDVSGGYINEVGRADKEHFITGGTFGTPVDAKYIAEGYELVNNGTTWTVAPKGFVAQIGDNMYYTLAEAVADAPAGTVTTITMIGDEKILMNKGVDIPDDKSIVIDLNGHKIEGYAATGTTSYVIQNRGILTITDSSADKSGQIVSYATSPDLNPVPGYASNTILNFGHLTIDGAFVESKGEGYASFAVDNDAENAQWRKTVDREVKLTLINGAKLRSNTSVTVRMYLDTEGEYNNVIYIDGADMGSLWVQDNSGATAAKGSLTIKNSTFLYAITIGYANVAKNVAVDIQDSTLANVYYRLPAEDGNTLVFENNKVQGYFRMDNPQKVISSGLFAHDCYTDGTFPLSDYVKEYSAIVASGNPDYPYAIVGPGKIINEEKDKEYSSIQDAINDAEVGNNTITVYPGYYGTYNIDIIQKEGVNITLQAFNDNVVLKNKIRITGLGRSNGTETLTIQGFTFDFSDAAENVDIISAAKKLIDGDATNNYAHNITIANNKFIGSPHASVVAIRTHSTYGLDIISCEGIGLHSLGQIYAQSKYLHVTDCAVTGGSGINYYGPSDAVITNLIVEVDPEKAESYGVRAGQGQGTVNANGKLTVIDSNLTARYPIWLRGDAPGTVEIINSVLTPYAGGDVILDATTSGKVSITIDGKRLAIVKTEAELKNALKDAGIGYIIIGADIDLTDYVTISRPVVLDGSNHMISGDSSSAGIRNNQILFLLKSNNITIKNLTIKSPAYYDKAVGINVFGGGYTGIVIDNVTCENTRYGVYVNGQNSEVTITNSVFRNLGNGGIAVEGAAVIRGNTFSNIANNYVEVGTYSSFDSNKFINLNTYDIPAVVYKNSIRPAVAKIGEAYYYPLSKAVQAAGNGDVIELLTNSSENITIPAGMNITIKVAEGKQITGTVTNNGTLRIDGKITAGTFGGSGIYLTDVSGHVASGYICIIKNGVYVVEKVDDTSNTIGTTIPDGDIPEGIVGLPVVSQNVDAATAAAIPEAEAAALQQAAAEFGESPDNLSASSETALEVALTAVEGTNSVTFEVKPVIVTTVTSSVSEKTTTVETPVTSVTEPVTFILYLPSSFEVGSTVKVTHKLSNGGEEIFYVKVQGDSNGRRFVTLTATSFSTWEITAVTTTNITVPEGNTYTVTENPGAPIDVTLKAGGSILYKLDPAFITNLNVKPASGCVLVTFDYDGGVDANGGVKFVTAVRPVNHVIAPVLTTKGAAVFSGWQSSTTSTLDNINQETTFTAQWRIYSYAVSMAPASATIKVGQVINLDIVVSGDTWNDANFRIAYDTSHFAFINTDSDVTDNGGILTFKVYGANKPSGEIVKTLSFRALSTVTPAGANFYFANGTTINAGTQSMRVDVTPVGTSTGATITVIPADARTYPVTLGNGLIGKNTATEGVEYTATIDGYDAGYDYTVTVKVNGNPIAGYTVSSTGVITVPGAAINGPIEITMTRAMKDVTVNLIADYVGGYTLILVSGPASNYSYNGATMFKTSDYGGSKFAYIVKGNPDAADVKALLAVSNAPVKTIRAKEDVNNTGVVDLNDVQAAWNCYNVAADYSVNVYMDVYLRADVNRDGRVDASDLSQILSLIPH